MSKLWNSEQGYLRILGRILLFFFPLEQVLDILSDYEELFSAESGQNSGAEAFLRKFESPWAAAQTILREFPQGKRYFLKWTGGWMLVLLLSIYLLFHMENGWFVFIALTLLALFGIIHGWQVREIERKFPMEQQSGKRWLSIHALLFILVIGLEAVIQYLLRILSALPSAALYPIARSMDYGYTFFQISVFVLFLWMLKKTVSSSILYYLGTVHALGALFFIWFTKNVWHNMDPDFTLGSGAIRQDMMICLMEYGNCLCLVLILAVSLKV